MGYTHYFRRRELEHDKEVFAAFIANVNKVLSNLPKVSLSSGGYHSEVPLVLAGGFGEGEPEVTIERVWFNGVDEGDMGHETFLIERSVEFDLNESYDRYKKEQFEKEGELFDFCKTARKPYDFVAQVVLILYKKHFGNKVAISSDGNNDDWKEALEFAREQFGIFGKIDDELEIFEEEAEVVI